MSSEFPSVTARVLLRALMWEPLSYRVVRQHGSHRRLESESGFPPILFAFHDRVTVRPRLVRALLVDTVGLTEKEARELL